MSGIPYNELQDVNCTVNDTDGTAHVITTLHYAFVIPCRECKHMYVVRDWLGMDVKECWLHADRETGAFGKVRTEPDGFCAWGERRES